MNTEYVFFDLGNVLFHFDHALACRSLGEELGVTADDVHRTIFESGLQHEYETGLIDDDEFAERILQVGKGTLSLERVRHLCSDIFSLNAPIVHLVSRLKLANFRYGILSNTCHAHWQFLDSGHFALLRDLFRERVLSYEEKSMKPDRKIYEAAIKLANCDPASIFFTDDRDDNVAGAKAAGLDAELFVDVITLKRQLLSRGVLS